MFRGDNDTISLRRSDEQLADSVWLGVHTINLDNRHVMLVELKILRCKGSHVDNSEKVLLAWSDRKLDVLCFVYEDGIWHRLCAVVVVCVLLRLVIVDETRSLDVVQVTEGQDIFLIDAVRRIDVVDDERPSEAINILPTDMGMIPVRPRLCNFELVYE